MIQPYFFMLLKWTVVIGLSLVSVLIIIRYYFILKKKSKPASSSARSEDQKILLPLRLQAYERIVLFLERISPNNILMRLNKPDMTAIELQSVLVKTIREEFEYNLSQQIYISSTAWEMVKNAKEETIKMINIAAGKSNEEAPSANLVRNIFELALGTGKLPVDSAIDEIKKEIQRIL